MVFPPVLPGPLATLHAADSQFRWWWPTNWMAVPSVIFVAGCLLVAVPVRRSPAQGAVGAASLTRPAVPLPGDDRAGVAVRPGQVVVGEIPREPAAFVARVMVSRLAAAAGGGRVAVVCAVTGLRGVGKTQIAAAYARARVGEGWGLVGWVNAETRDVLLDGLRRVAKGLGVADREGDHAYGPAGGDGTGCTPHRRAGQIGEPEPPPPICPALLIRTPGRRPARRPGRTGHILAPMSDEAAQPDDELAQAIRNAILAGAAEGAEATARRIAAAASTGLDEVTAVLQALAADLRRRRSPAACPSACRRRRCR